MSENLEDSQDQYSDQLSEYLDGELAGRARRALELHLATCAACRGVLDDLRAVSRAASALEDRGPEADLWPAIASRLEPRVARPGLGAWLSGRRFAFSLPQLVAAAALLVVLSGGAMWGLMRGTPQPVTGVPGTSAARVPAGAAPPTAGRASNGAGLATSDPGSGSAPGASSMEPAAAVGSGSPDARLASYDMTRYDATITELQDVIHAHRAELDTSTVRVIEQNLSLIDHAIGDARRALNADPANPYLNGHLAQQLQRKVRLLQQATDLVAVRQS